MKLKRLSLKFALGLILLSLFLYVLLSFSNVYINKSFSLSSFQFSQYIANDNTAFVILDDNATYIDNSDIYNGDVNYEEGVIYFNSADFSLSFVAIDVETLFLTKQLLYFERI